MVQCPIFLREADVNLELIASSWGKRNESARFMGAQGLQEATAGLS